MKTPLGYRPLALLFILATLSSGCSFLTDLGRLKLYPDDTMNTMGLEAYAAETGKYKEIKNTAQSEMVQRIGRRIAKACGKNYDWEFKLLDAPETVNAFALPGGKVAVYSGILKLAPDEDSLAAIMGHEIAHVTEAHGNERLTQSTGVNAILGVTEIFLNKEDNAEKQENNKLIMGALGILGTAGLRGYSRLHESEADAIGLRYLMIAGYDPHAAPKLWERMAKLQGGKEPGFVEGFLSTHPNPLDRARALRELIPKLEKELGKK